MNKRILSFTAVAFAIFAGCIKTDGGTNTPRAGVLIDLLSPDATSANIVLNGNTIASNIAYGSIPQYYNQVDAGATTLAVSSALSSTVFNTSIATEPGKFYSTFLVDSFSKMKAITVVDSVGFPATTDSIQLRFYNFAVNSPAINLWIKDSVQLKSFRPFETQASASGYNSFTGLKAGTYNFKIKTPDSGTTFVDTTITFEGKHIYTLFVKGVYGDSTSAAAFSLGTVRHG